MQPYELAALLHMNGTRRAYLVYDEKLGRLRASHAFLKNLAEEFSDDPDFVKVRAVTSPVPPVSRRSAALEAVIPMAWLGLAWFRLAWFGLGWVGTSTLAGNS